MTKSSAPILSYANARLHVLTCAAAAGLLSTCFSACGNSGSQKSSDGGAGGTTNVGAAGAGSGGHDGGSGGTSGADAGSDAGPISDRLGLRCNADTDCGAGLICLKAGDKVIAGGGPAHGYCSTTCTQGAVDSCASIGGVCFDYQTVMGGTPQTYCMKACTFGGTTLNDRVAKCQNRPDVACVQGNGTDFCLPTCSQDSDCAPRKCDLQFNICVDTPTAGDKVGAHCTVDTTANTTNCGGTCLQFGTATAVTAAMCSARCVLGELGACNYVDQTMSVAGGTHGVCAYGSAGNAFSGDLGFCTPECDSNADCPDTIDHASCDLTIVNDVGHGACSFTQPADGGTGAGPDAGRG